MVVGEVEGDGVPQAGHQRHVRLLLDVESADLMTIREEDVVGNVIWQKKRGTDLEAIINELRQTKDK